MIGFGITLLVIYGIVKIIAAELWLIKRILNKILFIIADMLDYIAKIIEVFKKKQ